MPRPGCAADGLIVVDECHHVPAAAFEDAVRQILVRRWLGRRPGFSGAAEQLLGGPVIPSTPRACCTSSRPGGIPTTGRGCAGSSSPPTPMSSPQGTGRCGWCPARTTRSRTPGCPPTASGGCRRAWPASPPTRRASPDTWPPLPQGPTMCTAASSESKNSSPHVGRSGQTGSSTAGTGVPGAARLVRSLPSNHFRHATLGQARRTGGRDSRPCMRLTGRQRSSSGGTASDSPGKRASRAPRATSASTRAREAPRQ